jgi:hypothetical protein
VNPSRSLTNNRKTPFMNKALLAIAVSLILFSATTRAQDATPPSNPQPSNPPPDVFTFGFGFGLDYGGLGVNATVYPQKNIGLFGSVGYALAGTGYNAGIKLRLLPNHGASKVRPFVEAMYGYNAAIAVAGNSQYNKLFYGPSVGAGLDIGSTLKGKANFCFAILVPIRSPDVNNYIDNLRNNYGVSFNNNLLPIAFSLGFRIVLG